MLCQDKNRFDVRKFNSSKLKVIEVNFLEKQTLDRIPEDIDAAYYLIHSMSISKGNFEDLEALSAHKFKKRIQSTKARQVIFLSGIVNEEQLSRHLISRKNVKIFFLRFLFALTLRAASMGSGSASFEIIRDLVKLPVMVAPNGSVS
jgi:hypothetical protein